MNALLQASVGDRPDELASAGERPVELRQRLDALGGVGRHREETPRGFAFGLGEQRRRARLERQQHPSRYWMRVKPQSDGIDENKPADRLRRSSSDFGGQQTAERM